MWKRSLILAAVLLGLSPFVHQAQAQSANIYCLTGSVSPFWQPASASNPCPVTLSGSISGTVTANQGTPNAGGANAWPVVTDPQVVVETYTGGTVTTGTTFQSVLAASASRQGCRILNAGTHTGQVFAGTTGSSHTYSDPVAPGQWWYCGGGGQVSQQNIDYTSTTTSDPFIVVSW